MMKRAVLSMNADKFSRMILKPGLKITAVSWEPLIEEIRFFITGPSLEEVEEGDLAPYVSEEEVLKE